MFVVGLAFSLPAIAQSTTQYECSVPSFEKDGDTRIQQLKNINRGIHSVTPDSRYMIGVEGLKREMAAANNGTDAPILMVDIRKPTDYEQLRIPGSINMAVTAIRTKGVFTQ